MAGLTNAGSAVINDYSRKENSGLPFSEGIWFAIVKSRKFAEAAGANLLWKGGWKFFGRILPPGILPLQIVSGKKLTKPAHLDEVNKISGRNKQAGM